MPSPIGHALAGVAIAWSMGRSSRPSAVPDRWTWKLAAVCAGFAWLPDIDLLYLPVHRTATHSIPVAILVTIIAVAVTGWVNSERQKGKKAGRQEGKASPSRLIAFLLSCLPGLAVGLAWSSHVLMDWLGADASAPYGIQMMWPFSDRWYFSGWDLFPGTERRQLLSTRAMVINLKAALQEIATMGSIALAVWFARRRHDRRRDRGDRRSRE